MPQLLTEIEIAGRLEAALQPESSLALEGYINTVNRSLSPDFKCAAVLLPLFLKEQEWHLVFTRRTDVVESHKGQVSFPGGGCDEQETTPEQTALREAQEEVGLLPQDVRILGKLKEVVTISHFRVTPVIGVIPWPYTFQLSLNEVSRVFSIPLTWLAQPENWDEFNFTPDGSQRSFPVVTYHTYDGEVLWGATARITHNFLEVLNLIHREDHSDRGSLV